MRRIKLVVPVHLVMKLYSRAGAAARVGTRMGREIPELPNGQTQTRTLTGMDDNRAGLGPVAEKQKSQNSQQMDHVGAEKQYVQITQRMEHTDAEKRNSQISQRMDHIE